MIDNRLVGRRICAMRQERGLTQQQLATLMNVSHQAVSKWEGGQALPDIQTLLELTRFFGITIEQLISPEETEENDEDKSEEDREEETTAQEQRTEETVRMTVQQLIQMAPFMTRETVEEIVLGIEDRITDAQLVRIAPFLRPECIVRLIEKHQITVTWEALRKIAPFVSRETVDRFARQASEASCGEDPINRTINDIGKAIDDIGKGVGQAVKKALRFGETVINEVSSVFREDEDAAEAEYQKEDLKYRPSAEELERMERIRRRAFERALADSKWDWIAAHICELADDDELIAEIVKKGKAEGQNDWLRTNIAGYVDEQDIEKAIEESDWSWLQENVAQIGPAFHERIARKAVDEKYWDWFFNEKDVLHLGSFVSSVAWEAMLDNQAVLLNYIMRIHMSAEETVNLAVRLWENGYRDDRFDFVALRSNWNLLSGLALERAAEKDWAFVFACINYVQLDSKHSLEEIAIDQGDFEVLDALHEYIL